MPYLSGSYSETPLDRSSIGQDLLDIERKSRSNPLKWNGQFSPQLVEVLLRAYGGSQATVLDPFVGSGTVLLEASRRGLAAIGTEINPAAWMLARLYEFANVPLLERNRALSWVLNELDARFPAMLLTHRDEPETIKASLGSLRAGVEDEYQRRLVEALVVLLDYGKPNLATEKLFRVWKKVTNLVRALPVSSQPVRAINADARHIPLDEAVVDLVVTSPPYINVFNYHQQYRPSAAYLGWDLLRVARSEIGANRKHRSNRFLTVIQYCLDLAMTLHEVRRVCKPDARLIFVVGRQSTVLGTPFFNGEIVAEVAQRAVGLELALRQERSFKNRFGATIYEDILHFAVDDAALVDMEKARRVARDTLAAAILTAPAKSRGAIQAALDGIDDVEPSPLFIQSAARDE